MSTEQKIVLKPRGAEYDEFIASAGLKAGHLLEIVNSSGTQKVRKHSTAGGLAERIWAIEDRLQGKTLDDSTGYSTSDLVRVVHAKPGTELQARIAAGAASITVGNFLQSAGDGTLKNVDFAGNVLYANTASSTAIAATAAETPYSLTYSIPADSLRVGDVVRIRVQGTISAATGAETFVFKVKIGSTVLATNLSTFDPVSGDIFLADVHFTVRVIGASGKIIANSLTFVGTSDSANAGVSDISSAGKIVETTLDTTAAAAITVTQTCSSTGETSTLDVLTVDIARSGGPSDNPVAVACENFATAVAEDLMQVRVL